MKNSEQLRLGFSLLRGPGGPTVFMSRLRRELVQTGRMKTTSFLDPTADILLFANKVRNPWRKPYVFRVDGITFDAALTDEEVDRRNSDILKGLRGASGVVFQARFCESLVRKHLDLPDVRAATIHNGVDLDVFSPYGVNHRSALGISRGTLVFVTSAKWRAHKRLNAVIACFDRFVRLSKMNARLLVLGELDTSPENVPDGVRFIGHVPPEDLPAWYRTADICLFFSWLDHCPNTVVEALACGLPVLCTNQGGTRELVELTQGGIVAEADAEFDFRRVPLYSPPEPDPQKLLSAVFELVQRRQELSVGIRRERIGIQVVAGEYVDFIESLTASGASGGLPATGL